MKFEATAVLLTSELDEAVRHSEIAGIRSGIEAVRRLYPDERADSIELLGGLVAFTGIDSPLSQAYGVGVGLRATQQDVRRASEFYERRSATPRVFVTPLTDPTLALELASAGFAPAEYENVLVCDDFAYARRDERIAVASDVDTWARASAEAFLDRDVLQPDDDRIAKIIATSDGVCALEGRDDAGAGIAATSAMDVRGEWSALFAGSTIRRFRRQGWHAAMIRDRMARARETGVRFLRATAKPASASERNFRRCGFTTIYTRTLWERRRHGE
ncbi:MAG: hypothetical protein JO030_03620 [Candidatus Eremiobacteraeota bacterium]|nr:hypothetical protein [Candidatus Eremiobacteraeota bacterium]